VPEPSWNVTEAPPDVAVLVALQEEFLELQRGIGAPWVPRPDEEFGGHVYNWVDPESGLRCVAASAGRMGSDESVRLAERLLRFKPAVLVNVGIAASLHHDVRIGDVIVPDMVYAYDKTAKAVAVQGENGEAWEWERRGDAFRTTHALVELARELVTADPRQHIVWQEAGAQEYAKLRAENLNAFCAIESVEALKVLRTRPEISVVCLASGKFVGASAAFARWIRQVNADIKALEMEAAGMLLSAEKRGTPPPTLVIRGISDHVDVAKAQTDAISGGAFRGLAMRNAVRLLRILMKAPRFPRHGGRPSEDGMRFEGPGAVPVARVKDFTGRVEKLAELERLLQDSSTHCVVVSGIGGLGKTTLVREFVAKSGPEGFPDGVAWLDGRRLIGELARVCRRFSWSEQREPTPNEATAFLSHRLANRRFLFVVDNFEPRGDPGQIPVLGGTCKTVVTSRKATLTMGMENAEPLELVLWSVAECVGFLRGLRLNRTHDSDEDLGALAVFVGRLPLGMRLIATCLADRPSTPATVVLAELRRQPLTALEEHRGAYPGLVETFQASWDAQGESGRRVLLALAVCAEHTRTEVIAAVAGVDQPHEVLDRLATQSLAQYTATSGTPWSLHEVLRMFIVAQPGLGELEAVHLAWVETHLAAHRDPLKHVEFTVGIEEAMCALMRLLDASDVQHAQKVYSPLDDHMRRVGQFFRASVLGEEFLRRCPAESWVAANCTNNLGLCSRSLGDVKRAIDYHERSFAVMARLGHQEGVVNAVGNLGGCYLVLGESRKAIASFIMVLEMEERLGRLDSQTTALNNLGLCHLGLGEVSKAIEYSRRSLVLAEKIGDLAKQADALSSLGGCQITLGNFSDAIGYLERSYALDCKLGREVGQAQRLGDLSTCFWRLGDIPKAIEFAERALAIFVRLRLAQDRASALGNLGVLHQEVGDVQRAVDCFNEALGVFTELGLRHGEATQIGNLGLAYRSLGRVREGALAHERALEMFESMDHREGQANQLGNLGMCHVQLCELGKARDCLRRAVEMYDRVGLPATHPSVGSIRRILALLG